jgi:hypothetical protein
VAVKRHKAKGKRQRAKGKSLLPATVAPHKLENRGAEGDRFASTFAFCLLPFAFCLLS